MSAWRESICLLPQLLRQVFTVKLRAYRDDFNTLASQFLSRSLCNITSDAANCPICLELGIVQEGLDHSTALVARRPENGDEFLGHYVHN